MILFVTAANYAYKKRKKFVSLAIAFILIAVIAYGFIVCGFFFNYYTVKLEICKQTSRVVNDRVIPFYGSGIASITTSFSSDAKVRMKEQIYEFSIAMNTLFTMYTNRLEVNILKTLIL